MQVDSVMSSDYMIAHSNERNIEVHLELERGPFLLPSFNKNKDKTLLFFARSHEIETRVSTPEMPNTVVCASRQG